MGYGKKSNSTIRIDNKELDDKFSTQLVESANDYSYTLGFLNGLNDIRTRAILEVNGFYSVDDEAVGKYRVLSVTGAETWVDIKDNSNTTLFQTSSVGEIRAVNSTKKLKVMSKQGIVNTKMFGAKGDGVTDDTTKLQNAVNSLNDGDGIALKGVFLTTDTITVTKNIKIDARYGTILASHNKTALLFTPSDPSGHFGVGNKNNLDVVISVTRPSFNTNSTAIGVDIVNSQFGYFKFIQIANHFTGLRLRGSTVNGHSYGFTYNRLDLVRFEDCVTGMELKNDGSGCWVTENTFYGGSFGAGYISNTSQLDSHIKFSGLVNTSMDNNKFFGQSLEGFHPTGINIMASLNNYFYAMRYEMPYATNFVILDSNSQSNCFFNGYGLGGGLQSGKVSDSGFYNRISASSQSGGGIEYYNKTVYEYVKAGSSYTANYPSGISRASIGGRTATSISASTGTVNIDFSLADHFLINVSANITSITFSNIPSMGAIKTICFIQNSTGNTITGFPSLFLGQNTAVPVNRAYGRDEYIAINGSVSLNEMHALSQYRS